MREVRFKSNMGMIHHTKKIEIADQVMSRRKVFHSTSRYPDGAKMGQTPVMHIQLKIADPTTVPAPIPIWEKGLVSELLDSY